MAGGEGYAKGINGYSYITGFKNVYMNYLFITVLRSFYSKFVR